MCSRYVYIQLYEYIYILIYVYIYIYRQLWQTIGIFSAVQLQGPPNQ
jgi:hypothetical protein